MQALAEAVAKPIQENLRKSPLFFPFCTDKTTDVSANCPLPIYLVNAIVHSFFISIPGLTDGTVLIIVVDIHKHCENRTWICAM